MPGYGCPGTDTWAPPNQAADSGPDDPLTEFLPEFPDPEAAREIRIEHLLTDRPE